MSLDLVVWLSCSVALGQDLPQQAEWRYSKITAESMPGLPKELIAQFEGHESWQIERDSYLIRASHADRVEEPEVRPSPNKDTPDARYQAELADKVRGAKMGVSLVLEGSYDTGYPEQAAVAEHLAKKCGGAVVDSPTGYYQIDQHGEWKP